MFFVDLIKEIYYWVIIHRVGKANEKYLLDNKIKRDWIGRMYTVVNLPEDIASNTYSREPYVLERLRYYDEIIMKMGLTEIIFPEFEPIPNEDAYLLVLAGPREYLDFLKIIWNILLYSGIFIIVKFFYNYSDAAGWIDTIKELITKYLF